MQMIHRHCFVDVCGCALCKHPDYLIFTDLATKWREPQKASTALSTTAPMFVQWAMSVLWPSWLQIQGCAQGKGNYRWERPTFHYSGVCLLWWKMFKKVWTQTCSCWALLLSFEAQVWKGFLWLSTRLNLSLLRNGIIFPFWIVYFVVKQNNTTAKPKQKTWLNPNDNRLYCWV